MALDVQLTQGTYWKGAQIPYWLYLVFVICPLTGIFGLDHLLLRSPWTAALKFLSFVPLLGFWYFYDIAQALGEADLVKKYGLAVPVLGPVGIGAGIFTEPGVPVSPPDTPRPWRYLAYVLASSFFFLPVNKLVLGDYWGFLAHMFMYIPPLTIFAILWGMWDIYRICFDKRGVFEKGPSRFFPASWFMDENFDRSYLGKDPALPAAPPDTWFKRLVHSFFEIPISMAKATSTVIETTGDAIAFVPKVIIGESTGVIKHAASDITSTVDTATSAAKQVVDSTAGTAAATAKAAEGIVGLAGKIPEIVEKISTGFTDPSAILEKAKQAAPTTNAPMIQAGGALISSSPSTSSSVLIFSVALVAFSGYVFYMMRKTYSTNIEKDDSPPDARAVRGPSRQGGEQAKRSPQE